MIEIKTLHNLLNLDDEAIKKFDMEQLRLMLGTFRYSTRILEREVIRREVSGEISGRKEEQPTA